VLTQPKACDCDCSATSEGIKIPFRILLANFWQTNPLAECRYGELSLEALDFFVTVQGDEIIVKTLGFYAAYGKPTDEPHLILRQRTNTDDDELLIQGWHAAMNKARELGWIV
jgi:hypothetical protein